MSASPPVPTALAVTLLVSGAVTMAVEVSASRLLAPYYGTTLIAWTLVIGTIMAALSVGYRWGGRLADRRLDPKDLGLVMVVSGLGVALVPWLAGPVLAGAVHLDSAGGVIGGLVGMILVLAWPLTLLGAVSPYAVRLLSEERGTARSAGSVYALGALGSLAGTFAPLVLVPWIGSKATILSSGLVLAATGLALAGHRAIAVAALAAFPLLAPRLGPLKVLPGLVEARETAYNFLQVFDGTVLEAALFGTADLGKGLFGESGRFLRGDRSARFLALNEGFSFHSVHAPRHPHAPLVGAYYDNLAVLPFLLPEAPPARTLILGLGAGTLAHQWIRIFPAGELASVDGVEIDPGILEAGRTHFGIAEAEATGRLTCHAEDARRFLRRRPGERWDAIAIDCYRQPYVPFHLATVEFFREVREHLAEHGFLVMNVVSLGKKTRFLSSVLSTVKEAFPEVGYLDVVGPDGIGRNCLVLASARPLDLRRLDPQRNARIRARAEAMGNPEIAAKCLQNLSVLERLRAPEPELVHTDDHSAIEWYSHRMLFELAAEAAAAEAARTGGMP